MAAIRSRYGKLGVDFRYLNIRCRETTALEDNAQNRKKLKMDRFLKAYLVKMVKPVFFLKM